MLYKKIILRSLLSLACILFMGLGASAQDEAAIKEGKTLFKGQCATCHAKDMKTKSTGPALGGVEERWADYPKEDLYAWIRGSQQMVQAGHPKATELWDEWKPTVMTNFPNLSDAQIDNILAYINCQNLGNCPGATPPPDATGVGVAAGTSAGSSNLLYILLFGLLALLALVLARIIANLNHMQKVQRGEATGGRQSLIDILTSKSVISFVIFALVILGGYTTVNNAIDLGRQQGYAPEQPIKFSHKTHAGDQKIDCQYCHDGARRSKHAVIPATNTCINCHAVVKNGSKFGTAEITKIYAASGFDPEKGVYIKDYDSKTPEEVAAIYKDWIKSTLSEDEKYKNKKAEDIAEVADEQWKGIVASLADSDGKVQGPVEWNRIHNLPDHVYFNHAQHVTVGKIECQTCHGKVEEMEVLKQYSPLSMGWCINCHRETKVQFGDNEYYEAFEQYHKEIKEGKRDKVTVEDIGGLECQKCHY